MFQFLSFKKNIDSIIAAFAGFIIIFLFTRHGGIGVWPDSVVYLSTAENLHAHGSLVNFAQTPLAEFPAFYPLFLDFIIILTGVKPLLFAPLLNSCLFAMVIYLSGSMMEQFRYRSKWFKIAVLSCIVFSPGLLEIYSMLCSETIFILYILLFIMAMHRYFQTYNRKVLITAALIVAAASVTRYAGITVIATGGLLLLLNMRLPGRQKWADILLYAAISPLPLLLNLIRNARVHGTMTGNRERSLTSLYENLQNAGSVIYDWLPFTNGNYKGAAWVMVLLILALFIMVMRHIYKKRSLSSYGNIAAIFSLLYISFIVLIASITRFEVLSSRFLAPAFIPLLFAIGSRVISFMHIANTSPAKWIKTIAVIIFLCFQYGQLAADYETWDGVKDAGIPGYTEDDWKYSPTVLYIRQNPQGFQKGYTIYSDANDAFYFFTGKPGQYLPHKDFSKRIDDFLNDHHCYVVWFNDGEDPDLVDLEFITKVKKMKLVKQFTDGAIYEDAQ